MKKTNIKTSRLSQVQFLLLLFSLFLCGGGCFPAYAGSESVSVSPGDKKTVVFSADPTGNYSIDISTSGSETIKSSDFKASFKGKTLWVKNSITDYSIAYTKHSVPPPVGIKGSFSTPGGGGGGGGAPSDFEVDAAGVTCVSVYSHSVAFGTHHLKIVVFVNDDDTSKITGMPSLKPGVESNKYFTIGAGPDSLINPDLKGEFNRSTDADMSASTLHGTLKSGSAAISLINGLIRLKGNYKDDLEYDTFPTESSSSYNSNSYISGIIKAAGETPPEVSLTVPGYSKPVPESSFSE